MVCVCGRFKSTGVLWRAFVTQVVTLSKLCLCGEVLFQRREGDCLPWASLWGVWALRLMYLGTGKTWNGWRVLGFLYQCLHIGYLNKTLSQEHRHTLGRWRGWDVTPAPSCSGHGNTAGFCGGRHISTTLKKAPPLGSARLRKTDMSWEQTPQSSFTEKPRQGLKLPAVRGHLSSAFCLKLSQEELVEFSPPSSALPGVEKTLL